jgi:hypothetical protein
MVLQGAPRIYRNKRPQREAFNSSSYSHPQSFFKHRQMSSKNSLIGKTIPQATTLLAVRVKIFLKEE